MDSHSAQRGHQPVRAAGRDASQDEIIATLHSPSADYVITLFKLRHEARNLVGIMLQVAVHGQNKLTLRVVEACGQR
jgi:hypothetical protein